MRTFTYNVFLKRLFSIAILLMVSKGAAFGQAMVVSFTSNPPASNNIINICKNQAVVFTNTSSNVPNNPSIQWTFNGGSPASSTSSNSVSVVYANSGSYNVVLNINNSLITKTVVVGNSVGPQATLNLVATTGYSTYNNNGNIIFRRCGSTANNGIFSFTDPNQSSFPNNTIQTLNWGDGSTNTYNSSNPNISHTYNLPGSYVLTYTVEYPNGCIATSTYEVFIGNNPPQILIQGSGADACLPSSYSFSIGGVSNQPGTYYEIIYNDGSPMQFYSNYLSIPQTIQHTFQATSCATSSSVNNSIYPYAYSIQAYAKNGCNPIGTYAALGPIYVSEESTSNFTMSPSNVVCVNSNLNLTASFTVVIVAFSANFSKSTSLTPVFTAKSFFISPQIFV